jgi:hypothetical protein
MAVSKIILLLFEIKYLFCEGFFGVPTFNFGIDKVLPNWESARLERFRVAFLNLKPKILSKKQMKA